jgi:hypothetical protein
MYQRYLNIASEVRQSIFLWGPRKVGKSTYLKTQFPESVYYDLLKTDSYLRYLKQPFLLRQEILALEEKSLIQPIIIDEIQKIPALLDEVHWLIENTNSWFILCGSSARKLKKLGVNLLGGRAIKYNLGPLAFPEIKDNFDLIKIFNNGLIPSHYQSLNARKLLKAYIEDYLTQEIKAEALVRNIAAFNRFIDSIAFSHGELINYSNISRDCSVDAKTIKEYYQILVDTLIGHLIYPYSKKVGRDIISSTPKFYLFDVGLANRIINKQIVETKGPEAGKSLEHYVFIELKNYINLTDLDHQINYWRTKTGLEVDFVITQNNALPIPIEVKISSNVHQTELRGIKAFMHEHEIKVSYIVSLELKDRLISVGDQTIHILSLRSFLEKLWSGKII